MAKHDRAEMLKRVREKMLAKKGGRRRDPYEWKAPQVPAGQTFKAKAYILPPVESMEGLWFTQIGDHWINRQKFPCPRVYDGDKCPYCQLGFDLLSETDDQHARSEIGKAYLPRTQYAVNLWFPSMKSNPDDLQDEVKYYALPKTIFDKLEECLQRDDAGDDELDPQPWGLFYDEQNAYPLSIEINRKGDYNSYEKSKLLAIGIGPIAESDKEIQAILNRRHDIPSKYPTRTEENLKALQGFVDALLNGSADNGGNSTNDDDGFDADENVDENVESSTKKPIKDSSVKKSVVRKSVKDSEPEPELKTPNNSDTDEDDEDDEDDELANLLNAIKNDS
jgi:hypothetical protein